jgi:hypothetical protein
MPWIYNPTRDVSQVALLDGTAFGFPPRKKVFVQLGNMSAEVYRLIQAGKLVNQGGDPAVVAAPVIQAKPVQVQVIQPSKPDTSSAHHETGARVAVDSSIALDGGKESKAVKKQDDDLEKAASVKPEADPDLKKNDTKTEKRGSGSRKR